MNDQFGFITFSYLILDTVPQIFVTVLMFEEHRR